LTRSERDVESHPNYLRLLASAFFITFEVDCSRADDFIMCDGIWQRYGRRHDSDPPN
jgi:hypothetical protein